MIIIILLEALNEDKQVIICNLTTKQTRKSPDICLEKVIFYFLILL